MDKVDLKKELKNLYNPSAKEVSVVDVPAMNFLVVNGEGAPTSPQYSAAIEVLFSVAYTLKFTVKKSKGIDYSVMPLESLWWVDEHVQIQCLPKRRVEVDSYDNAAQIRHLRRLQLGS